VAKHAAASAATIDIRGDSQRVLVEIADDGAGGADIRGGSGLAGLADRVEALGGWLRVESPPREGTRLCATLPLSGEQAGAASRSGPSRTRCARRGRATAGPRTRSR